MKFKTSKSRTIISLGGRKIAKRSLVSYLTASFAAILSCLCCTVPIALSALGFSDLADHPAIRQYNWIFYILAALAMLAGMFFLWYHHSHQYTKLWDDLEFWLACLFMVILFGLLTFGTNAMLSKYAPHQHLSDHNQYLRSTK